MTHSLAAKIFFSPSGDCLSISHSTTSFKPPLVQNLDIGPSNPLAQVQKTPKVVRSYGWSNTSRHQSYHLSSSTTTPSKPCASVATQNSSAPATRKAVPTPILTMLDTMHHAMCGRSTILSGNTAHQYCLLILVLRAPLPLPRRVRLSTP